MDRRPRRGPVAPGTGRVVRAVVAGAIVTGGVACGESVFFPGDAPGVMRIVAGRPGVQGRTVGDRATGSSLSGPAGVAVSPGGILYVADRFNRRVLAVRPDGGIRIVASGTGAGGADGLREPRGLALGGGGVLLVADPGAHRVWKVGIADGSLEPVAGTGERGTGDDGLPATETPLDRPTGVAVGPSGRIYVSERGASRVRRVEADGTLRTVAGTGRPGFSGDGGPAASAELSAPSGIAVRESRLWIADTGNERIREVDLAAGTIRTVAGTGVPGFGGDGAAAGDALLDGPRYVDVSPDGRTLFIVDTGNRRVRRVDLPADRIATFAGTGGTGFTGDLRSAGETALPRPGGVAVGAGDLLFVADADLHVVWRTGIRF